MKIRTKGKGPQKRPAKVKAPRGKPGRVMVYERERVAAAALPGPVMVMPPEVEAELAAGGSPQQQGFGFDSTFGFLGEEFLLWLWWMWETEGGDFALPNCTAPVGIAFDDVLVFAPLGDDDTVQALKHGMPTRATTARTALRGGHRVGMAKLIIGMHQLQWSVTIDGATMACRSVKLPKDSDDIETASERTAERAGHWKALQSIVEGLFERFLEVRTAAGWFNGQAKLIAEWMGG